MPRYPIAAPGIREPTACRGAATRPPLPVARLRSDPRDHRTKGATASSSFVAPSAKAALVRTRKSSAFSPEGGNRSRSARNSTRLSARPWPTVKRDRQHERREQGARRPGSARSRPHHLRTFSRYHDQQSSTQRCNPSPPPPSAALSSSPRSCPLPGMPRLHRLRTKPLGVRMAPLACGLGGSRRSSHMPHSPAARSFFPGR